MSLTIVDRVVSYFDPARGLARWQAREQLAAVGGYDSGRRDRRSLRTWRPASGSADADTLPDLAELRARSRDLARNQPIAVGALATTVTGVIGAGLKMQPAIDRELLGMSADQANDWQNAAAREWCHFCETADYSRVQPFDELQALFYRSHLESGDAIMLRGYRKDGGNLYGTKIKAIEADRLSNPNFAADKPGLAGGVEYADGVPVAYHFSDAHPGEINRRAMKWTRVPAFDANGVRLVVHLFERKRPDLTRGVPYLAPVIEALKMLGTYSSAEVSAAVGAAMIVAFAEQAGDPRVSPLVGDTNATAANGPLGLANNEAEIGSLALVNLKPGQKVSFPQPGRPNAQFDAFVRSFLRQVGVALQLPFELLVKHFTASYSASRAALEMAWQFFSQQRAWFAARVCQEAYQWMLDEAAAFGRLPVSRDYFFNPIVRQAYAGAEWIGPRAMSLDPLKEIEADAAAIALGITTRQQVCRARGTGEFDDVTAQLGRERAAREAAGLVDDAPAAARRSAEHDAEDAVEDQRNRA